MVWVSQIVRSLRASVEALLLLALPPPGAVAQLANPRQRYLTLWPLAYSDSETETAAALAPFETCPAIDRALVWQINTHVSWDDLFAIEGAVFPEGHRYDVGIIWSDANPHLCWPACGTGGRRRHRL